MIYRRPWDRATARLPEINHANSERRWRRPTFAADFALDDLVDVVLLFSPDETVLFIIRDLLQGSMGSRFGQLEDWIVAAFEGDPHLCARVSP